LKKTTPRRKEDCPCGSGQKYKNCCALKEEQRRLLIRKAKRWVKNSAILAGVVLVVWFAVSELTTGFPYTEVDIAVVNFSGLTEEQRDDALREANQARCNCGCGMTLAQCVSTDSTCPVRTTNIRRIEAMVDAAGS